MPSKDPTVIKKAQKRYRDSVKGRAHRKAHKAAWNKSPKGRERKAVHDKKWRQTDAYKATVAPKMKARRTRRLAWLRDIKSRLSCSECGYNKHPAALQFHHTGNDKVGSVTALLLTNNASLEVVVAEIVCRTLCQLPCYSTCRRGVRAHRVLNKYLLVAFQV